MLGTTALTAGERRYKLGTGEGEEEPGDPGFESAVSE